ncbi:MAG TPA: hypothetical protein VGC34_03040, partial [Steroidobacteraceae bacterium]
VRTLITAGLVSTALSGCLLGPNYQRPAPLPTAAMPDAFKESSGWQTAQPRDAQDRGAWWRMFNDPQLDALLAQVDVNNNPYQIPSA